MLDTKDWVAAKRALTFFVGVTVLVGLLFRFYQVLVVPIGISIFFTYLFLPWVNFLEKNRVPRTLGIVLILLFLLLLLVIAFLRIIPELYHEVLDLVKAAPAGLEFVRREWLIPLKDQIEGLHWLEKEKIDSIMSEFGRVEKMPEQLQTALFTLWNTAPHLVGTLLNIFLVPMITLVLLKDFPKLKVFIKAAVPEDLHPAMRLFVSRMDETLRTLLRGQLLIAAILGVLYIVSMNILGIKSAFSIGLIAGVCRLIPYCDVLVGGSLALVAILANFNGIGQVFGLVLMFFLIQTLDGMLLTPRILGERLGLHPLVVIVSVFAFADLMGFWGILLAIPIVALLKQCFLLLEPFYKESKWFRGGL